MRYSAFVPIGNNIDACDDFYALDLQDDELEEFYDAYALLSKLFNDSNLKVYNQCSYKTSYTYFFL